MKKKKEIMNSKDFKTISINLGDQPADTKENIDYKNYKYQSLEALL